MAVRFTFPTCSHVGIQLSVCHGNPPSSLPRSGNPFEKPRVFAGYFSHPDDIKVLVEGVKFTLAMAKTHAFKKLGTRFWDGVPMPGCEHTDLWSDEYWACLCRQFTR